MKSAVLLPRISTNVRLAVSSLLVPELASALAERLFLTPPRAGASSAIDLVDARGAAFEHKRRAIATWEWGWRDAERPAVLLAHGWGGHAAQMRPFVFPLLAAGYRVVAFDQPAHGVSEGRITGLPDFADVLASLAARCGPVHGVIAHSLAAAAATYAVSRGLRIRRLVAIGASLDVFAYSRMFARWHWISERVRRAMEHAIEERFGVGWSDLDMARLAPRLSAEALVIHDRTDRIVPWRRGAAFARQWPGARLLVTEGLGHARILRDDRVAQAAAQFISGKSDVAPVAAPALPTPAPLY
jgi:pimeloyl-ACP methyl ester carboxylesterase